MILRKKDHIFDYLPPRSIVLVGVDCFGMANFGIVKDLNRMYPSWSAAYIRHCRLYQGCSEDLLGKFFTYDTDDGLKICAAFTRISPDHVYTTPATDLWNKICDRLEQQVKAENREKSLDWSIHVQSGLGFQDNLYPDQMDEILRFNFEQSPVELVIHGVDHMKNQNPPPETGHLV